MKRVVLFLGSITVAVLLTGCGVKQQPAAAVPAVDTSAQDQAAVRSTAETWGKAVEDKNLDETVSFYADDAWVYPQNAPIAKTPDQRRSVWAAFFATPGASDMEGSIERVEVAHSGDLAVEYDTFAMTMNDKKGKAITETEKSVVTWKKQADGKWKVIADIWNTDK
jgi:ketosteroid isomerase-like protein